MKREKAQQVVDLIEATYPAYIGAGEYDRPKLYDHEHEELPEGAWSIAWEGGTPEDWTIQFGEVAFLNPIPGVFVEPINNCILAVFDA